MSKVLDRILSPGLRKILLKILASLILSGWSAGASGKASSLLLLAPPRATQQLMVLGGAPTAQPRSVPQAPKLTLSLTLRFESPRLSQGRSSYFSSVV